MRTLLLPSALATSFLLFGSFVLFASFVTACGGPDYPNCENDSDCHEGEFCVNRMCQQCRDDRDCPQGQRCASGACDAIIGYCESNDDCPDGQECRRNRCSAVLTSSIDGPPSPPDECGLQAVYFGFDDDDLDAAARSAIQQNSSCLQEKSVNQVHVTGHADPRGTEEYNLALGDRRARSVADYLETVGSASVTHSSMGEEMAGGSDETSWRRDRRVDFVER